MTTCRACLQFEVLGLASCHPEKEKCRYVGERPHRYQCSMQASSLGWYLHEQPAPLRETKLKSKRIPMTPRVTHTHRDPRTASTYSETHTHTDRDSYTHTDTDTHTQRPTHCLNSLDLTLHTDHLTDNSHSDFLRDGKMLSGHLSSSLWVPFVSVHQHSPMVASSAHCQETGGFAGRLVSLRRGPPWQIWET